MKDIIAIIIGMSLVTYIPRMIPLVVISKIDLPNYLESWLNNIPIAILTALLTLNMVVYGQNSYNLNNKMILAALPTILVAIKTESLIKTVLTGIISMAIINLA
ncbi:MAG: Branched-chain amino acid transport protein [Candidatus Methanohalarchaeum thermophilum]|uniref:Branched-chain amino acid transport protein n=1 Tax=Methanohalarchaeum thermophilum TaxID=1903181 RepID=A0A1Q6DWU7_METT1|nr:MAG: Branched-chain amino acid transport protein [Candidatus Methanohalarchaeum thermophilum]